MLQEAEGYKTARVSEARGEADRFNLIYDEYRAAPRVTRERMFLETMETVLGRTDNIILDSKSGAVPILPLDMLRGRQRRPGDGTIVMQQRTLVIGGIIAAIVLIILANALYIVPVDKQAIVIRVGSAQYTVNATEKSELPNYGAGLHLKIPLVDDVRFYDKRNQGYDLDAAEVIAADQQRLNVDAIARWRIKNPLQYFRAAGGNGEASSLACVSPPPCAANSARSRSPTSSPASAPR